MKEETPNANIPKRPIWVDGIRLFGDITSWIAVPIVAALIVGKYLDKRFGTEPWVFIGLAGFGFGITCYGIVKIAREFIERQKIQKK